VAPQAFQVVILAGLRREYVNDKIAVVGQNPLGVVQPFHTERPLTDFLEALLHFLGNGLNLTRVGAGGDDEVVGKRGHVAQIEDANLGTFPRIDGAHGGEPRRLQLFGRRSGYRFIDVRGMCGISQTGRDFSNRVALAANKTSSPILMVHWFPGMQKPRTLLFALCSLPLLAQTPATNPDNPFSRQANLAADEVRRISGLVECGALPRARLDQALANLADAQDDLVLRRTLYAPAATMTEDQSADMLAAAQRRVDRQTAQIETMRVQIDAGIAARNAFDPLKDELRFRQNALDLARERARLLGELAAMARAEQSFESGAAPTSVEEHFAGKGEFTPDDLKEVEAAWQKQYDHPMPISANGDTAAHRALGFDHRGRVDVAVTPDQPEGVWLRQYLEAHEIPFFAFRSAVPGKATGAHIHIGPGSVRLARLHEAN
jgi:hypothetical protein